MFSVDLFREHEQRMIRVENLRELSLEQILLQGIPAGTWLHDVKNCKVLNRNENKPGRSQPTRITTPPQYSRGETSFPGTTQ